MGQSQTTVKDPNETMNVGLINVSDNNKTFLGIREIISGITVLILLWLILKWCFKCYRRRTEQRERTMEEMTRRNARPTAPIHAHQALPEMIPTVSFQQPGERVVMMRPGGSEWKIWRNIWRKWTNDNQLNKKQKDWDRMIVWMDHWNVIWFNNFVYNNSFLNSCFPIVTNKCNELLR